jgi:hypothetical protein
MTNGMIMEPPFERPDRLLPSRSLQSFRYHHESIIVPKLPGAIPEDEETAPGEYAPLAKQPVQIVHALGRAVLNDAW